MVYIEVCDSEGDIIKCVDGKIKKGLYCLMWDMKYVFINLLMEKDSKNNGLMVLLGSYIVILFKCVGIKVMLFFELVLFELVVIVEGVFEGVIL